jgi:molybdopterin-guanine dinucleotide biosynthesis protein A
VCAVDLPLLHPAFVRRVVREVQADAALEVALPVSRGRVRPLAAVYRTVLAPRVAELVDAGTLRAQALFDRCRALTLDEPTLLADETLATADPRLESLLDVNTPAEYEEARGRPAPSVRVECFGALAMRDALGPWTVSAATVRAAAAAVGLVFDASVVAVIEEAGAASHTTSDPDMPLVRGDSVAFLPAGEHC